MIVRTKNKVTVKGMILAASLSMSAIRKTHWIGRECLYVLALAEEREFALLFPCFFIKKSNSIAGRW
jgi:hypothetical protein